MSWLGKLRIPSEIGTLLEDITPALKAGLSLDTAAGIIVADVVPDSPAEQAGLRIGDILLSVNGRRVESVSRFRSYAYFKKPGEKLVVELQRGEDRQRVEVVTRARPSHYDPLAPLGSPDKYVVPRLGILGIEIDQEARYRVRIPEYGFYFPEHERARAKQGGDRRARHIE